jgi:hypothetical protein
MYTLTVIKHSWNINHSSKMSFISSKKNDTKAYLYYYCYYAGFLYSYWLSVIEQYSLRLAQNPRKILMELLIHFFIPNKVCAYYNYSSNSVKDIEYFLGSIAFLLIKKTNFFLKHNHSLCVFQRFYVGQ